MTAAATRLLPDPRFRITLVHDPASEAARETAAAIERHFFGDPFRDLDPGLGIDISFRSDAAPGADVPLPIVFSGNHCDCVVLIADDVLVESIQRGSPWDGYLKDLARDVAAQNSASQIFVVALDRSALPAHMAMKELQHIRWCSWPDAGREKRLMRELTHAFCVLLRPWVNAVEEGRSAPSEIDDDPDKVTIFISHSKSDGEELALSVRRLVQSETQLGTFFDSYDILPGRTFANVIEKRIRKSAVLVVQTDTFASREWCRLEVLTARRLFVPVVVLHAVRDREARSFPYLGNVPVVAGAGGDETRIADAIGALLDQCLESFYWRLHAPELRRQVGDADAVVLPHAPDLLTLAQSLELPATIVYPDPPLGAAESELIGRLSSRLHEDGQAIRLLTPMSLYVEEQ